MLSILHYFVKIGRNIAVNRFIHVLRILYFSLFIDVIMADDCVIIYFLQTKTDIIFNKLSDLSDIFLEKMYIFIDFVRAVRFRELFTLMIYTCLSFYYGHSLCSPVNSTLNTKNSDVNNNQNSDNKNNRRENSSSKIIYDVRHLELVYNFYHSESQVRIQPLPLKLVRVCFWQQLTGHVVIQEISLFLSKVVTVGVLSKKLFLKMFESLFNKVAGLFSREISEIFKNIYFEEHIQTTSFIFFSPFSWVVAPQ